ncbi:MAG: (2Fe-2S)-binding protein [Bacillaceae bacterium]|jgi:carbon-monoxide dehydrogenase small subunit/2-furoyl-CoA dehydrogenase 2Fe-2S iron sulfur subunit|uniref:4-hydroxybenzoyl-CoA reductase subunit gamma n=2 Tax=Aeribacillus TaxID=1055323 RepID=A0A165Y8I0_9BACI|nr:MULTISPECIES: (2Fe-2S)-binding protein [Aeribacillus]REJ15025.1 MAG: (2Fe-2S)-binding protein [Bacillaceae bacterium]ASS90582.1 4-hydroxybenzoyl-CoA reductase subunit gamma [Aeribacillus pallidus]KZN96834.1 4-hydroxybenzoyl-CoA reductase subunit gamma [Aeribacillus pallidus]MDR9793999.1 (2Fe-2S)-binding protein [Aeribacillus pallidus]MDR9796375.1 (2Fe-2S)-binding protein [Aeribacillus pallidus]
MSVHEIEVTINGKKYKEQVESRLLLSDFLRETCGLTGTHVGCEHGVCGACTIHLNGSAVRSCLIFAVQVDGQEITTVEGLGEDGQLTPLQKNFIECHGLQCGFCTPGILMSATDYLQKNPNPSVQEIKEMLSGHLCRCTGYVGIIEAIQKTVEENSNHARVER